MDACESHWRAVLGALCSFIMLGGCDERSAPGAAEREDVGKDAAVVREMFDRLVKASGNLKGGNDVYDCYVQEIDRDWMRPAYVADKLKNYYAYWDAGQIPPPAERSQLEGAMLVAMEYVRQCQPTPLRSPEQLVGPKPK